MAANTARRKLECDCGYVALCDDDDEFVAAVQGHASEVHGMKLSAALVLTLADGQNPTVVRPGSTGEPQATTLSPGRTRPG